MASKCVPGLEFFQCVVVGFFLNHSCCFQLCRSKVKLLLTFRIWRKVPMDIKHLRPLSHPNPLEARLNLLYLPGLCGSKINLIEAFWVWENLCLGRNHSRPIPSHPKPPWMIDWLNSLGCASQIFKCFPSCVGLISICLKPFSFVGSFVWEETTLDPSQHVELWSLHDCHFCVAFPDLHFSMSCPAVWV